MKTTKEHVREQLIEIAKSIPDKFAEAGVDGKILFGISLLLGDQPPDLLKMMQDFHDKFGFKRERIPRDLPAKLMIREKHQQEETQEYHDAVMACDVVKQYDALLDIVYLALGTMYLCGFPIKEGLEEVHRSNMTKEYTRPGTGKNGSGITKGENYEPPRLLEILQSKGYVLPSESPTQVKAV